uniref:WLM domain-containing protein n=1 Tax=viral metagenome TaxID=1070528 RepID=A0A6C0CRY0_9ZZZZ
MKISFTGYLLIGLLLVICTKIYFDSDYFNLKCIISDVDGKKYCVRERQKLELAADKLASASVNMQRLVDKCHEKYQNRENVKRLKEGFNPKRIQETLPTSQYTAYSENKGEKLAFCLDKNKNGKGGLIDDNTLMFVAIHELAHVASESIGHTDEFWRNFKFLLQEAEEMSIYTPIDYKKNPKNYCGMEITDNPYFDY